MNLSMRWLDEFVHVDTPIHDFCEALTMSGSKVEGYEVEGAEIENVVVGKVLAMERHPDSDHMWICQVDVGKSEPVQIVTGAQNVHVGDLVPAALHKSHLPGGITITKGKLRGVESNGMLCSLKELGLTTHDFPYAIEDGIFILQEACAIGEDIRTAIGLNDTVVEFEITSNRPDCLSIIGLARETAATYRLPLHLHTPVVQGAGGDVNSLLKVRVENTELCQRYMAAVVRNIKVASSPRWLRERLRACGVRPINNIVDITNYVMLEYGQPMHAFDLKYVKDGQIVVRNAAAGETITTLDGTVRELSPEMLVIADAEKPSAVAGVMGGEYSGIHEDTDTIVFESACFKGSSVRLTAKKLGMRTESSGRFEKGLDPMNCEGALLRALELVEQLGAGEVVSGVIDIDHADHALRRVPFDADWMNRFLGISLTREEMVESLRPLEIAVVGNECIVPSYRADLEQKADIAEEVARMYGYDKIPTTALRGSAEAIITPEQDFERRINNAMIAMGYDEIVTYSFMSPKMYDKICLPADHPMRKSVVITNPLGEDTSIMRTTGLPSMLDTLARNYNNRNPEAWLYEISSEYLPREGEDLPEERAVLMVGCYGGEADFFTLKGTVESLLSRLNLPRADYTAVSTHPSYHPGRFAVLTVGEVEIGSVGEVHPTVLENFGIGCRAWVARLDIARMFAARLPEATYHALPRFPPPPAIWPSSAMRACPLPPSKRPSPVPLAIFWSRSSCSMSTAVPLSLPVKRASPIPWCCVPPTAPSPWRNAIRPSKKRSRRSRSMASPCAPKIYKTGRKLVSLRFFSLYSPALYATIVLVHHLGPPAHPAGAPYAAPGRPQLCTEGRVTIWPIPNPPSLFPSRKTGKRN